MMSVESIELFEETSNQFPSAFTCTKIGIACDTIEKALYVALDDLLADLAEADQHLVECAIDGIRDRMLGTIRSIRRSAATLFDEASI